MESHSESEEGNLGAGGNLMDERTKALAAAAAAALPGINYMTAHFPMSSVSDVSIMHPLSMPFFQQAGNQFLASSLPAMPMFLHPASLQRSNQTSSVGSPMKEMRVNNQQADINTGIISHPVIQFPSIYMPQQLAHLQSLPEGQNEEAASMDGVDKRSPLSHEGIILPFNFFSGIGQQGMQISMQQPMQQQQQQHSQGQMQQLTPSKDETPKSLKQPKRALTPYMRFSKEVWQRVKAQNPDLSVCAIGAAIGRMWRELPTLEKEKYNEEFSADKIRYEDELQQYLKATGLQASDLAKSSRHRKKDTTAPYPHTNQQQQSSAVSAANAVMQQLQASNSRQVQLQQQQQQNELSVHDQQQQQQQLGGGSAGLPAFSQFWAAGGVQPMLAGMVAAQQQQQQASEQQLVGDATGGRDGSIQQASSDGSGMWQQLQDDGGQGVTHLPPTMYNPLTIQHVERTRHDAAGAGGALSWHRADGQQQQLDGQQQQHHHHHQVSSHGLNSNGGGGMLLPNGPLIVSAAGDNKKTDSGDTWGDILGLSSFGDKHQQQQQHVAVANSGVNGDRGGVDTSALESEVNQLRYALTEKTREAQRLTSELEQAHDMIVRLQQQIATVSTVLAVHDSASSSDYQEAAERPEQEQQHHREENENVEQGLPSEEMLQHQQLQCEEAQELSSQDDLLQQDQVQQQEELLQHDQQLQQDQLQHDDEPMQDEKIQQQEELLPQESMQQDDESLQQDQLQPQEEELLQQEQSSQLQEEELLQQEQSSQLQEEFLQQEQSSQLQEELLQQEQSSQLQEELLQQEQSSQLQDELLQQEQSSQLQEEFLQQEQSSQLQEEYLQQEQMQLQDEQQESLQQSENPVHHVDTQQEDALLPQDHLQQEEVVHEDRVQEHDEALQDGELQEPEDGQPRKEEANELHLPPAVDDVQQNADCQQDEMEHEREMSQQPNEEQRSGEVLSEAVQQQQQALDGQDHVELSGDV